MDGVYSTKHLINTNYISFMNMVGIFLFKRCRSPPIYQFYEKKKLIGGRKMVRLPKRRKSKDNPYTIIIMDGKYYLTFKDSKNIFQTVELSMEIYEIFNKFELEDISQMHKVDKHIEHSEVYEESLYKRALEKPMSLEEQIEYNDDILNLKQALDKLPETQKRRIKMYYFDNLSLEQIAQIEECSFQAISKSILTGVTNLKKNLKK